MLLVSFVGFILSNFVRPLSKRDRQVMLGRLFISGIRAYQIFLSPLLGKNCRFYPTCSQYAVECLNRYSLPLSFYRIIMRLGKCHPWHPGGIDLP